MQKLSRMRQAELGLEEMFAGRVWAFVPVMAVSQGISRGPGNTINARLGVAIANERGYMPIPLTFCNSETWDEMADHADELNEARGLTIDEAARITCSSMAF